MLAQPNISEHTMDFAETKTKVAALTAPRNVVLVGASDRPGSWAARVWRNLNRYKFPGPLYLLNPRRSDVFGQPCYRDFASLPEPPDHLVVLVPAPAVADLLRRGGGGGGPRSGRRWRAAETRRDHRRNGACRFRPELHGQHLRQVPAGDADRRPAACS
jgi:hypothetical protein